MDPYRIGTTIETSTITIPNFFTRPNKDILCRQFTYLFYIK